jgi:NADPH2:quinone reductase
LAAELAGKGPYDLVVDYLWGAPAEAAFDALTQQKHRADAEGRPLRYILVGVSAGEVAALPAMTLRVAPVQLMGSGTRVQPSMEEAAAAYDSLLELVAEGEVVVDVEPVPLSEVASTWCRAGSDSRVVFLPS